MINSFYGKLASTLIIIFLITAGIFYLFSNIISNRYENEVSQKLHANLAQEIVNEKIKLVDGEVNIDSLKMSFMNLMVLGPSFEFYLLNPQGEISAFSADPNKVKRKQVSLRPIQQYMNPSRTLPIKGDDPRSKHAQKIFSVAPIIDNEQTVGYVYVIIGGEIYDSIASTVSESKILSTGFLVLLAIAILGILILLTVFSLLTKPLRKLSDDMLRLKSNGFRTELGSLAHWNPKGDEIQQLGSDFNDMAIELKQQFEKVKTVDQVRKELIAHISHDIRTPLAALLGYLETWQLYHDDLSEEKGEKLIQTANENGQKISHLVEQLFELARLDQEQVPLMIEPFSIAELASDVIQNLKSLADEKQIRLDVVPISSPVRVLGDISKLERVLTNLLDNAIRHCRAGDSIVIELLPTGNQVEIAVSDTGIGIPKDELKNVLTPHYQAENSVKGMLGNAGLGLTITDKILKLHNSHLEAQSEEHKGARFSFKLEKAKN